PMKIIAVVDTNRRAVEDRAGAPKPIDVSAQRSLAAAALHLQNENALLILIDGVAKPVDQRDRLDNVLRLPVTKESAVLILRANFRFEFGGGNLQPSREHQ